MNQQQAETHNLTQFRAFRDKHGEAALERLRSLILKRAESFPDRSRTVAWEISVDNAGEIHLDVRP